METTSVNPSFYFLKTQTIAITTVPASVSDNLDENQQQTVVLVWLHLCFNFLRKAGTAGTTSK